MYKEQQRPLPKLNSRLKLSLNYDKTLSLSMNQSQTLKSDKLRLINSKSQQVMSNNASVQRLTANQSDQNQSFKEFLHEMKTQLKQSNNHCVRFSVLQKYIRLALRFQGLKKILQVVKHEYDHYIRQEFKIENTQHIEQKEQIIKEQEKIQQLLQQINHLKCEESKAQNKIDFYKQNLNQVIEKKEGDYSQLQIQCQKLQDRYKKSRSCLKLVENQLINQKKRYNYLKQYIKALKFRQIIMSSMLQSIPQSEINLEKIYTQEYQKLRSTYPETELTLQSLLRGR